MKKEFIMSKEYNLYWIGVRESEILDTGDLFQGSISVFGSGIGKNISFDKEFQWRFDCNIDHPEWIDFVNENTRKIIKEDPTCKFMLYYPADYDFYNDELKKRVICLCNMNLITLLENKIESKLWLGKHVPIVPYILQKGECVTIENLKKNFYGNSEFVIQASSSCGGSGTWFLSSETSKFVINQLKQKECYIITPYIAQSVSVNVHTIIYDEKVITLPPSVQIISHDRNTFSYVGADFIAYRYLSSEIRDKIRKYTGIICNLLQEKGYKGVCGIDFIATANEVYFMEVNSRFQASTILLNKALSKMDASLSVQHLHMDAFLSRRCCCEFQDLFVDYSFYCYSYHKEQDIYLKYIYDAWKQCSEPVECIDNFLDWTVKKDEDTYLFEFIFNRNIVSVTPEYNVAIEQNIPIKTEILTINNWQEHLLELKIMLLNHGVHINSDAIENLKNQGGPNYLEFNAIDISFCNLYFNVPYSMPFTWLSPFVITLNDTGGLMLNYYNHSLGRVSIRTIDKLGQKIIKGHKYNDVSYLGVDRLRIYHRCGCYYKERNLGCRFCDIENEKNDITFQDICTILDAYNDTKDIRHYLIGGGSDAPESDFVRIKEIAKYIKQTTSKSIYLMCTPPTNAGILEELYKAGVTEVTFNLEVFDRQLAKKYMPGKSILSLEVYDYAFKKATEIWGRNNGKVRCAFIIGLEPKASLFAGVEYICQLGVSPILSLFKPIPGTPLEHMLPPSDKETLQICKIIEQICNKYNIELGPSCPYCEDNTLKVSASRYIPQRN